MSLLITFLGTGTSAGIPMIACDCRVCRSEDPRDRRTRSSVLIRYPDPGSPTPGAERTFLIDTSPELRLQALAHDLWRLDGVFYTHCHADHVLGIDDLRRFNAAMEASLAIHAEAAVIEQLRRMFGHIFESHRNVNRSFVADLIPQLITPGQRLDLFGAIWTPIRLLHGRLPIVGFRVDQAACSLAYCTDVSSIPPESYPLLDDLDLLVIDALRYRHHPTHMTVDQALKCIEDLAPRRALLTHIAHDISHADLSERLPDGVELAYDGLSVRLGPMPAQTAAQRPEAGATFPGP